MAKLFETILKSNAGFTAIEYGLIAAFSLVLMGQVVSKF
jgi:Flp pilus assembly pilin Flp